MDYVDKFRLVMMYEYCSSFFQIVSDVTNNILSEKHELGWSATQPQGTEGDNLMKVMETFCHVISRSLQNHVTDGYISGSVGFENAYLSFSRPKIGKCIKAKLEQLYPLFKMK